MLKQVYSTIKTDKGVLLEVSGEIGTMVWKKRKPLTRYVAQPGICFVNSL